MTMDERAIHPTQVYSAPEIADLMQVSRDKVREWQRSGELRTYTTSTARRAPRYTLGSDILTMIDTFKERDDEWRRTRLNMSGFALGDS